MEAVTIDENIGVSQLGVGLRNYRNDCFLNATLQALFHIPTIIDCMLKNECYQDNCVTCCLRDTFVETRKWSRAMFPSNLYSLLKTKLKDLLNGNQQDAHNFFLRLLDSTRELQHEARLIPSIFESQITSTAICNACGDAFSRSTKYFSIPIDIPENARIHDAVKLFFEREDVEKRCDKCQTNVTAVKQFKMVRAPSVLCLQIKRFSPGSKINALVEITRDLTISSSMQQGNVREKKYVLKAVVCHRGSLNSGHYKTIVLDNNKFYEYDDSVVKSVHLGNIFRSREAYLLFYELESRENEDHLSAAGNNNMANNTFTPEDCKENASLGVDRQSENFKVENTDDPGTLSNNYMANENLGVQLIKDENSDLRREERGTFYKDSEGTRVECFNYMANESEDGDHWQEIEMVDFGDDQEMLEVFTDSSRSECPNYMTNESRDEDDWQEVGIVDVVDDHDMFDELTTMQSSCENDSMIEDAVEVHSVENENEFSGRRIINVDYFLNQLQQYTDIICKKCHDGKMNFYKETRRGLASTFSLSCTECGNTKKIFSDDRKNTSQSKINESAALGIVSVGLGFYHLEEFCTILGVPCMSYKTYLKNDKVLQTHWGNLCKKLQEEALNEEIRLAKHCNEVDSAGNALIAVKADGSWHTRSYGTNYTSLAGCAAIIGVKTNKIVYLGVKNKYCHVCKMAQGTTPKTHKCNANYDGSSSGMETEIIVEGFKYCATKGARFNKFIGDGDSNTYKNLRDLRLYRNPTVYIDKYDCLNHIDKNFKKKFIELCGNTKYNKAGRNLLTQKIGDNIRKGARSAAKHWRATSLTEEEKCTNLEKDFMNAPLHCFGIHDNCADYFCSKSTAEQAREYVGQLKSHGLYLPVINLCQFYFANKVKSWLAGYETNVAEGFNSLITKYTGAKRIFEALSGSYNGRVDISGVQFNTDGHSTTAFQEYVYKNPQKACLKLEDSRKRKNLQNAIRNDSKPKKRKNDVSRGNNKKRKRAYGEGHEDLDFTPSQLDMAKRNFLQELDENRQNSDDIQLQTKGQRFNARWYEVRQNMLTSSYFGRILNARNRKSYTKIVEDILYHNEEHSNTAELVHQRSNRKNALKVFSDNFPNECIDICGIFIDAEHCFLGASPFRLCGQDGVLMVQCPHKLYGKTIADSIEKKLLPFWKVSSGTIQVNCNSQWYKQIQGQLHICNKTFAYLIVYLSETEFKVEKVLRDDDFWNQQMKEELLFFFNEAMVKELVNPRDVRNMELRVYDEANETFV